MIGTVTIKGEDFIPARELAPFLNKINSLEKDVKLLLENLYYNKCLYLKAKFKNKYNIDIVISENNSFVRIHYKDKTISQNLFKNKEEIYITLSSEEFEKEIKAFLYDYKKKEENKNE